MLLFAAILYFQNSYSQPGRLDASFGNKGIVRTDFGVFSKYSYGAQGKQVLTQRNGTIYLTFETHGQTLITRLLADGRADASYANNGYSQSTSISPAASALQKDGKIVVVGSSNYLFAIVRYSTNGTLDTTFSKDGKQTTDFGAGTEDEAHSIAIQKDGKIIVVGVSYVQPDYAKGALARYNTDGSLDTTFSQVIL